MSEAGIEVRNDNNKLVVDSLYKNLMLSRKVLISQLPDAKEDVTVKRLHLNPGEIVAAVSYPKGSPVSIIQYNYSGYCDFYGVNGASYTELSSVGSNYVAYVFGVDQKAKGNTGLQIFNDNGDLIFDSNAKYMRVSYYGKTLDDVPYPDASKTYAIAQLGYDAYADITFQRNSENGTFTEVKQFVRLGKDKIEYDAAIHVESLYYPLDKELHYEEKCFSYMLIDVTGY